MDPVLITTALEMIIQVYQEKLPLLKFSYLILKILDINDLRLLILWLCLITLEHKQIKLKNF